MYHDILTNKRNLYKRLSRREFLVLVGLLPFLNSFKFINSNLNDELSKIISKKGTCIIADISTGQIIGCSNFNKAFHAYTIGSLGKLITSTALLEEKVINKDHSYYCKGSEIINGKKKYCWNPNGHGKLSLESALTESCNLYFLNYSKKIASEDILKYYKIYNLNKCEPAKELSIETNFNIPSTGLNTDIALGLNKKLLLSPAQMLSLTCTIARNGIYKPLWVKKPSTQAKKLNISESTIRVVQNGMSGCGTTGTAKLLTTKGFSVAAKTGTAPYIDKKTHGWCIGYTPIKKPKIAFCTFIDEGTGFSDAVPITSEILKLCQKHLYI